MFTDSSKTQQLTVGKGTGQLQQTIGLKQSYSELCSVSKQLHTPAQGQRTPSANVVK